MSMAVEDSRTIQKSLHKVAKSCRLKAMTSENSYEITEEEQDLFERRSSRLSRYMAVAVQTKTEMEAATTKAFDAGAEFGFELGSISKETNILAKIDELFHSLTDEEEDAKLTLGIVKQAILNMGEDENDGKLE